MNRQMHIAILILPLPESRVPAQLHGVGAGGLFPGFWTGLLEPQLMPKHYPESQSYALN